VSSIADVLSSHQITGAALPKRRGKQMKAGKKSQRKLNERRAGWTKTMEHLKSISGISDGQLRAYRMPGSNKRKRA